MTIPPTPLRVLCRKVGETEPSWFLTTDCRLYMRWGGDFETVTHDQLILVMHGNMDMSMKLFFPPVQQERFQPPKHG